MAESKVLFVTHKYPPSIGGMQKHSFELIQNWYDLGPIRTIIINNKIPRAFFFLSIIPRVLFVLLTDPKVKYIHANDGLIAMMITPFLMTRKKLCVTIHGLDIVYSARFYQYWVKKFLSRFDLVVAVSEQTRKQCIQRGIAEEKVHFVPNAVDLKKVGKPEPNFMSILSSTLQADLSNRFLILSVGRPVIRKGFSWFVNNVLEKIQQPCAYVIVAPKLRNSFWLNLARKSLPKGLFLMMAKGFGLELDYFELRKILDDPRFKDKVFMITDELLGQLYIHADLFVMPNIPVQGEYEGFGLVLLEAASAGTMVLASDLDGVPSAVQDGENGILLPPENSEKWAEKVNELLADESLRNQLQEKFSKTVIERKYTWKEMTEAYKKLFDQL